MTQAHDKKATSFTFDAATAPESIVEILEGYREKNLFSRAILKNERRYFGPNADETSFDCVSVYVGGWTGAYWDEEGEFDSVENVIEVALLHPTADPAFESQHWELFHEVLDLFAEAKLMHSYDWRASMWPAQKREQEKLVAASAQGRFHVKQLLIRNGCFHEGKVIITNDPVVAYNTFTEFPQIFKKECRCEIKDVETGNCYFRDSILRSYEKTPSSFEEIFFVRSHTRCGESYRVGKYAFCRRDYYNLMTGDSWMACPGDNQGAPLITQNEREKFRAMYWPEYPVVPVMSNGTKVEVKRPKPSKYFYTEPYSGKAQPVYPEKVEEALDKQLIEEARVLIPKLWDKIISLHALNVKAPADFQLYVTLCAAVEKSTGEDLYKQIPVPR